MTEPATPAAEPSTDRLSSYYNSLFPGAGSPAIQEMVRLRRDHDRTCGDYFKLYCAAMGVEPSTFSGTQSSDPVQDVATERARLVGGQKPEHKADQLPLPDGENIDKLHDALYDAWGVIANAAGWPNGPTEPHPDWLPAAQRWRDRYHRLLGDYSELGRQERRRAAEQRAQPEVLSESESHVRQLARRHSEWIEQRLAPLGPGETLCVHEEGDFFKSGPDALSWKVLAHVLTDGQTCDASARKTQYRPAGSIRG